MKHEEKFENASTDYVKKILLGNETFCSSRILNAVQENCLLNCVVCNEFSYELGRPYVIVLRIRKFVKFQYLPVQWPR